MPLKGVVPVPSSCFCSELVAYAWMHCGLLLPGVRPHLFWPGDFAIAKRVPTEQLGSGAAVAAGQAPPDGAHPGPSLDFSRLDAWFIEGASLGPEVIIDPARGELRAAEAAPVPERKLSSARTLSLGSVPGTSNKST